MASLSRSDFLKIHVFGHVVSPSFPLSSLLALKMRLRRRRRSGVNFILRRVGGNYGTRVSSNHKKIKQAHKKCLENHNVLNDVSYLTKHFTNLEPRISSVDEFSTGRNRRSTYFETHFSLNDLSCMCVRFWPLIFIPEISS